MHDEQFIHPARPALLTTGKCTTLLAALIAAALTAAADPSNAISAAARDLLRTDLDVAESKFEAAMKASDPSSPAWIRAAFGLATSLHQRTPPVAGKVQEAARLFERIHALVPNDPIGLRSLLMLARIHELPDYANDEVRLEQARAIYRQLADTQRYDALATEAAIRYASTYLQETATDLQTETGPLGTSERLPKVGIAYLESYLQKAPQSPLRNAAWEYLGRCYWRGLQDERKTLECWLRATGDHAMLSGAPPQPAKQNVDRINPGYLYWGIATLAQKVGERAIAIEYYRHMIIEVPRYKGTMAQLRLRELGVPEAEIPVITGSTPAS